MPHRKDNEVAAKAQAIAKKKAPPEVAGKNNNRGTLIKALIIGGTFAAIAILSIVTQGPGDGWPGAGVVALRIILLSACALVYFWMLYHTRARRQNDEQKSQPGKK